MPTELNTGTLPAWDDCHQPMDVILTVREYLDRTNGTKTYGYGNPVVIEHYAAIRAGELLHDAGQWNIYWKLTVQYRRGILTMAEYEMYLNMECPAPEPYLCAECDGYHPAWLEPIGCS